MDSRNLCSRRLIGNSVYLLWLIFWRSRCSRPSIFCQLDFHKLFCRRLKLRQVICDCYSWFEGNFWVLCLHWKCWLEIRAPSGWYLWENRRNYRGFEAPFGFVGASQDLLFLIRDLWWVLVIDISSNVSSRNLMILKILRVWLKVGCGTLRNLPISKHNLFRIISHLCRVLISLFWRSLYNSPVYQVDSIGRSGGKVGDFVYLSDWILKAVKMMKYSGIGQNWKKEDQVHFEDQVVFGYW